MCEIADDLDLDAVMIIDLRGNEVGMHDLLLFVRVPLLGVVLDHVVAEGDHEVGLLHEDRGIVGLGAEADRVDALLGVHVDATLRHERADDANSGLLDETAKLLGGTSADTAVAGEDDGPLCTAYRLPSSIDDLVVGNRAPEPAWLDGLALRLTGGDVLRQLNEAGAGLLSPREPDGFANDLGNVVGVIDGRAPTWSPDGTC